jgi:ankyrin repeat protein
MLLGKGADVNASDKRGLRALAQAATNGHLETVQLLIENKASVNAQDDECGVTPLMGAAASGHASIVRFLLQHGADPQLKAQNEGR